MDEIHITTTGVTTIPADRVSQNRSAAVQALAAVTGAAAGAAALLGLVGTRSSGVVQHAARRDR